MQIIFFLPTFLYGIFLSLQGDPLLLLLTVSAVGIWAIPMLQEIQKPKQAQKVLDHRPPSGAIIDQTGRLLDLPLIEGISIWQMIGSKSEAESLFVSIAQVTDQECWLWSSKECDSEQFMRAVSGQSTASEKQEFVLRFLNRATIPLDLNLMVDDLGAEELKPIVMAAGMPSPTHSFRILTLSSLFSEVSEKVTFGKADGVFILRGEQLTGGQELRLLDTSTLEEPQLSNAHPDELVLAERLRRLGHNQDA